VVEEEDTREEEPKPAKGDLAWICPGCSSTLWGGVGCKVRCPTCGYFEDCNAYV